MQSSAGYTPTASTSTGEPTVLATAHSLRSSLSASFSSANSSAPAVGDKSSHLLHPLGPFDPSTRSAQLSQLQSTLSSIRSAVTAFSSILPPPSDNPAGAVRAVGDPNEKHLALLKETASSEAVLLSSLEADAQRAKQLLARRDDYAHLYPVLTARQLSKLPEGVAGARGQRTIEVLEGIAASLGLMSFKDTSSHIVDGASKEVHTLSLGGKVMVVDVEVEADGGRALRVKVSYVLDSQHESEGTARRIEAMLRDVENLGEGADELVVERGLKGFRETLRELKRLDEMTEETTVDCFAIHEAMLGALHRVLQVESGSPPSFDSSSHSHGLALPITHSHHAKILFHASPLAQLSPDWTKAAEGGFAAGEDLDRLLTLEGVASLKVSLLKPQKDVVPLASYIDEGQTGRPSALSPTSPSFELYHSKSSQWPHFIATTSTSSPTFRAHFSPGVPITKGTGRRIMAALGISDAESQAFGSFAAGKLSSETTWIEDLLVSPRNGSIVKFSSEDGYHATFDDLSFSQDFSLAEPSSTPGYLCTDVRFRSPAELFKVIEILKEQQIINDLFKSAFSTANRVASSPTYFNKRRKLSEAVPSFESLFAPTPSPTLPVFLHLSSTSPPSLSLSFPTPNAPPTLASPLAVHIRVDSASLEGVRVQLEGKGMEKLEADKEKLEKVVAKGRDVGLVMRWISKRLEKV
ncbi:hypothetical protein BCR35DRAFT_306927 [Leucosporidium creatinivorum]|uniref:Mediator of RNA polymerase II transcription subunit 1 n=1 Tax=Leucosporidium creatinivorum TaxID=106004 RepID=A0A1Y2EQE9_9BASI|nr:hypothetical protein BCR35DRAFT_306927 [Leucosporidium creatinivorum]